jgi:hypothetical protein
MMTRPNIRRLLGDLQVICREDIVAHEARGHSGEGYRGGYCDALADVQLWLNGAHPMDHRGYWRRVLAKYKKQ